MRTHSFGTIVDIWEWITLWQGKATGCVEYLTGCGYTCESFNNPADFIMDVVLGNEVLLNLPTGVPLS